MKKYHFILLIYIITSISNNLYSQESNDTCLKHISGIVLTFNNHKHKYLKFISDSLIVRKEELEICSNNLKLRNANNKKKLDIYVFPCLYLNSNAEDFVENDNICKYLELDTINYEFEAYLFKNDKLYLYCSYRGYCACDVVGVPHSIPSFQVEYYEGIPSGDFDLKERLRRLTYKNNDMILYIKGFGSDFFYIKNNQVRVGNFFLDKNYITDEENPSKHIIRFYGYKLIRRIAEDCQPIKK